MAMDLPVEMPLLGVVNERLPEPSVAMTCPVVPSAFGSFSSKLVVMFDAALSVTVLVPLSVSSARTTAAPLEDVPATVTEPVKLGAPVSLSVAPVEFFSCLPVVESNRANALSEL